MKTIPVEDAVGHILCHDLTRIVRGEMKQAQFKKGHVVTQDDIPLLLSMGKTRLYVWENSPDMMHEDEAAQTLETLCRGVNIDAQGPCEGKIEHFARINGLLRFDADRLLALNMLDGLVVVSRKNYSPVKAGELIAGMKAVPLLIAKEILARAGALCPQPLFSVLPYTMRSAGIVTTGSEIATGRITDTFTPVVRDKLRGYGIEVIAHAISDDSPQEIDAAIVKLRAANPDIIICTGGMSVDPDDGTPRAIRRAVDRDGGRLVSYGVPVMPGVMFLLAYFAAEVPIIGLPGCVMFAQTTIFDILLPRFAAGVPVTKEDLAKLANGGLCYAGKGCNNGCHYPHCSFGKD